MRRTILALTVTAALATGAAGTTAHASTPPPSPGSAEASLHGSGFVVRTANGTVTKWSTAQPPTVTKLSTGGWRVRFPGITGDFGVANVGAAQGVPGSTCTLDAVAPHNGAMAVTFHCNDAAGAPADAGFVVYYTSEVIKTGWSTPHLALLDGTDYVPSNPYNWKGKAVTASNDGLVRTRVTYKGLANPGRHFASAIGPGALQCVTASVEDWPDAVADVRCSSATSGQPTGGVFTSHLLTGALFPLAKGQTGYAGAGGNPAGITGGVNSNGGAVGITRVSKGVWQVMFTNASGNGPRMSLVRPAAVVPGARCNSAVSPTGTTAVVTVKCWNAAKQPIDTHFDVVYFGAN